MAGTNVSEKVRLLFEIIDAAAVFRTRKRYD